MKFLIKLLSSGLFVGYTPKIPGTASTIVYAFIYLLVFPDNNYLSLILITLFLPFSVIVSHMAEKVYGKKDDQRIVIDEVIGIWIGLVFLPKTILFTILGTSFSEKYTFTPVSLPIYSTKSSKVIFSLSIDRIVTSCACATISINDNITRSRYLKT